MLFVYASCKTRSREAFDYEIFDKSCSRKPKDYDFFMMAYANNTAVDAKMANLVLRVVLVVIVKFPAETRMVGACK